MSKIDNKSNRTALGSQKPKGEGFGQGKIIVEKINPQNTSKKFSSFIQKGSSNINIDGTEFMKSTKGAIYLSKNKLVCGNVTYPFNRIIGIVRSNDNLMNSVETTVESIIEDRRYHVKLKIIMENSDKLFKKLGKVSTMTQPDLTRHTMKNQSNFLKDRFGLRRN